LIEKIHGDYPQILIMVITALSGRDENKRAMDLGAGIFLCKPMDMKIYKDIIWQQLTARPVDLGHRSRIRYLCQPQGGKDVYELIISVPDLKSTTLLDEDFNLLGSEEGNFLLIYKGKYHEVFRRYSDLKSKGW
jgi:hypothetical protein